MSQRPEQQSKFPVQAIVLPVGRQATQVPLSQRPEQHCEPLVQAIALPVGRQQALFAQARPGSQQMPLQATCPLGQERTQLPWMQS